LPAKTVAAFAADSLASGYEGGVQIETGKHPTLHYEATNPAPIVGSSPATVAARSSLI
jgi:hypothetical protein